MSVDILNLEFPNIDRDRHIITPVYMYLRKHKGLKIKSRNLHYPFFNILVHRPRMILISNAHGDDSTYLLLKFLHGLGFNIVTTVTEGNFHKEYLHGYLWGWNKDFKLFQDGMILWNTKSKEMIVEKHPELEEKLFVSGATGFDRYKIFTYKQKSAFLEEFKLTKYKKVLGIASFGIFDHIDRPDVLATVNPYFSQESLRTFQEDLIKLRSAYRVLIQNNPDTLFILRVHPQLANKVYRTEFSDLLDLPNIFVSSSYGNLPSVADAISISDFWIGYESTTSIEGWLLNKMTVYLNPTRADFQRENHYRGCLIVDSVEKLQSVIDRFYRQEKIEEYDALNDNRENIIKEVIEHGDGKNHVRAAELIYTFFQKAKRPPFFKTSVALFKKIDFTALIKLCVYNIPIYWKIRPNLQKPVRLIPLDKDETKKYEQLYENV